MGLLMTLTAHRGLCDVMWGGAYYYKLPKKTKHWVGRMERNDVFFKVEMKWNFNCGVGGVDVGGVVTCCNTQALKRMTIQSFQPLVPYLSVLANTNVHCQSRELPCKASGCLVESTRRICWKSFIWKNQQKIILYIHIVLHFCMKFLFTL